ncbi:MAG: transposase [Microbacterium sp.]
MGRPSKYPSEFRREAVELVRSSGRSRAEVARSLGVSDNTLRNWVIIDRERRERDRDPEALTESERVELRRLRRERSPGSGKRCSKGRCRLWSHRQPDVMHAKMQPRRAEQHPLPRRENDGG